MTMTRGNKCIDHSFTSLAIRGNCFSFCELGLYHFQSTMLFLGWHSVFIVVLVGLAAAQDRKCDPNECLWVKCGVKESSCTKNQIYRPNGGMCGCCSACVTQLGEGEACILPKEGYSPPTAECGKGLKCDWKSNTCVYACGKSDSSVESY